MSRGAGILILSRLSFPTFHSRNHVHQLLWIFHFPCFCGHFFYVDGDEAAQIFLSLAVRALPGLEQFVCVHHFDGIRRRAPVAWSGRDIGNYLHGILGLLVDLLFLFLRRGNFRLFEGFHLRQAKRFDLFASVLVLLALGAQKGPHAVHDQIEWAEVCCALLPEIARFGKDLADLHVIGFCFHFESARFFAERKQL